MKVQRQPREKFSAWSMFEQDIGKVAITGANGDARNWQMSLKVIF